MAFDGAEQFAVADEPRLADDRVEADAGVHKRVVALSNAVGHALVFDRRGRGAGDDERLAFGPADHIRGLRFGEFGRVEDRAEQRAFHMLDHVADHLLVERAGLGGGADEHARLERVDDGGQVVRVGESGELLDGARVLALTVSQAPCPSTTRP